jgi:adenylyl cyclase-associated protein
MLLYSSQNRIRKVLVLLRIGIFNALQKYVRANHTTGLVWNSSPGSNPPASGEVPASQAAKPSDGPPPGAPPPPPPPPAGLLNDGNAGGGGKGDNSDRQALFASINKGEGITSGLKKVTSEMQTHKNPNLRASSNVPAGSKQGGAQASTAKPAAAMDRPPKIELKDYKIWQIEYQKNNDAIKVETDKKQAVYIYKCENSVVQVKGKVNSITMDGCKKTR